MAKSRNNLEKLKNFIEVPLSKIDKAPWNYKEDDPRLMRKLVSNFRRNGQLETVILREMPKGRYEMVNGNHRLDAMREIGDETVVGYNLGKVSEATARRVAVETNETKFASNDALLSKVINEILGEYDADELVGTLPYTAAELDDLRKLHEFSLDNFRNDLQLQIDKKEGAGDDGDALPIQKSVIRVLPEFLESIKQQAAEQDAELLNQAGTIEMTVKQVVTVSFTEEEFKRFCTVFEMNPKNKYSKDRLLEFLNSIHATSFMSS